MVTSFSLYWLWQRQASHSHTPNYIQGSSFFFFYHGRESFPETFTDLSFCLTGQKKWVKCHFKTNQCQRALDCHSQLRLILLHLLELGAGSPLLSPRLPTRCVHSNIVIHVYKVGTRVRRAQWLTQL